MATLHFGSYFQVYDDDDVRRDLSITCRFKFSDCHVDLEVKPDPAFQNFPEACVSYQFLASRNIEYNTLMLVHCMNQQVHTWVTHLFDHEAE